MIIMAAGSKDISTQEVLLNDRLKAMHSGYEPYSWKNLSKFLGHMQPLEKFENTSLQNFKHRYKYPTANLLIDLLSGSSTGSRASSSIRRDFMREKFPGAFNLP